MKEIRAAIQPYFARMAKLELAVSAVLAPQVVTAITEAAHTENPGDGPENGKEAT